MDNRNWYFRQKITEAELDAAFADIEEGDLRQNIDTLFTGVMSGLVVTQQVVPDLTVIVGGPGVAYSPQGRRMSVPSNQTVNCAVDSNSVSTSVAGAGNSKIISIFLRFARNPSDPRIDGNSNNVFFIQDEAFVFQVDQSAEAVSPTPPPLLSDGILLCDITRTFGQTTFVNANIGISRRQDMLVLTGSPFSVRRGTVKDALQDIVTEIDNLINGLILLPAASISYAGGGAWADGTTNPATTVEGQLDKVISDLAAVALGVSGGHRVGYDGAVGGSGLWADGTGITAGTVAGAIDEIVSDLANGLGGTRIGTLPSGTWQDGTTVSSATVQAQINEIVSDLASSSAGVAGARKVGAESIVFGAFTLATGSIYGQLSSLLNFHNNHIVDALDAHDASAISYAGSGTWADGSAVTAIDVESALDEVVSDLATSTGGTRIGVSISSTWQGGATIASTTVRNAIDEIVSDLASITSGGGANLIGAGSHTYLTATSIFNQLATVNSFLNTLVESIFGDGSDGTVTLSVGTTVLTRDMFYSNLTVPSGAILQTNNFRVFVKNALVIDAGGVVENEGPPGGAGGVAGIALASGTLTGAGSGGTGGTNASGLPGTGTTNSYGGGGNNGGTGGGNPGGTGGTATAPIASRGTLVTLPGLVTGQFIANGLIASVTGGGGGGGGGAAAGNTGAGGGAGAGVLFLIARQFTNSGTIRARGGAGGTGGGAGSRGGGGGGGGGYIHIVALSPLVVGTTQVTGGLGSAGSGGGSSGLNGTSGTVTSYNLFS